MPGYIAGLLESFERLNPDMRHLVFDESTAAAFIGEHFSDRHLKAFQSCAVPAMQADYFSYCAILALGGVYSDADAHCTAGLRSLVPAPGQGRLFHRGDSGGVIHALFAFGAPGHAFLELVMEILTSNIERRISDRSYFVAGPPVLTSLYWLYRLGSVEEFLKCVRETGHFRYGPAYVEAIGDFAQVERAFDGITVFPASENVWVRAPKVHLAYKETDVHFTKAKGRIFK